MSLDLLFVAEDLSAVTRPPVWRVFSWLKWRRHQQPVDIARGMSAALRGEFEPMRRYGIALSAKDLSGDIETLSDEVEEEIFRQTSKLRGFADGR